ncbi:MAG: nucleotidyltransferase domain-containing protein [Planctomycetota bacterium]|jgi:predicted nucleotidyltransferase|nr:nucleotidyltransferase domain-containing protein [Planctomycetota bacterium]
MKRHEVLQILAGNRERLRQMAVKSLALFGSVARNEAADSSDVDLLVEFDRPVGYFHFLEVQEFLESALYPAKVDLVVRDAVFEELKEDIYGEAVHVL